MVEKFGITVNEDGEVRYSASLIEGLTGDDGTNTVKASTMEELLEKLNKVKESQAEKLAEIPQETLALLGVLIIDTPTP